MQGIFIDHRRPKSKKEVKAMIAEAPARVDLESTSMFGNEQSGPVSELPVGSYTFVGPDPYTDRKFYGTLDIVVDTAGERKVVVK